MPLMPEVQKELTWWAEKHHLVERFSLGSPT